MTFRCESAYVSECGSKREINQDAVLVSETDSLSVYLVADGMGGHEHGELASRGVVTAVKAWLEEKEFPADYSMQNLLTELTGCLKEENNRIFTTYNTNDRVCGTTLALLVFFRDLYAVLSVGDSRIYRLDKKEAVQITSDDVWETDHSMTAGLSEEQIRAHPNHGKLIRAFGTAQSLLMHRLTGPLTKKAVFLLCSDGIYKYCDESALTIACRMAGKGGAELNRALEQLVKNTEDNGTKDNYTAIIVRTG